MKNPDDFRNFFKYFQHTFLHTMLPSSSIFYVGILKNQFISGENIFQFKFILQLIFFNINLQKSSKNIHLQIC